MRTTRSSSHWGGVCLSACWDTPPGVGLETPPGCGPGDPPQVWAWRHTPLGVGLETTPRCGPGDPHRPDPSVTREAKGLWKDVKQTALELGCGGFYTERGSWQMTYVVTSHHMCHLPEVRDDAFDVTHWATSVGKSTNQCVLARNSQTTYGIRP